MRRFLLPCLTAILLTASPALAAGEKSATEKGRKLTGAPSYLPLNGLSTSVDATNARAGSLIVDLSFDIPDPALHARMSKMGPRLRDAMRTALANYVLTHHRRGAAPDLVQMKRQLQAAADRAAGGPGVTVLLANVMVQT
jgi:hypothetical protein